ncbi:hypothetical protein [Serratia marcescens]|uniref:hypothetical protein n=1 Tax=Serratia marcescens TaxID=615 RepID=UPI000B5F201B|nr:hypothetical protein [Serratia marcescens]ASM07231.1 hypothetical protein BVG91_09420 [Serratia marcescens]
MAEKSYSELPAAQSLTGTEILSISQLDGSTLKSKKTAINDVKSFVTLKAAVKGGNWASSYGPGLGGTNAHGHMGACEYWKTTLELDKAAKDSRPPFNCVLQAVPCTAGGEMLPFNLHVQYKSSRTAPQVIIVLLVFGEAAQVLDLDSGKYSPLGLVEGINYEPKYTLTYWY